MIAKVAERFQLADNLGQAKGTRRQIVGARYPYGDYYGKCWPGHPDRPHPPRHRRRHARRQPDAWTRRPGNARSDPAPRPWSAAPPNPLAGKEQTFRVPWLKPYYVRPRLINVYIMGDPSRNDKTSTARRSWRSDRQRGQ